MKTFTDLWKFAKKYYGDNGMIDDLTDDLFLIVNPRNEQLDVMQRTDTRPRTLCKLRFDVYYREVQIYRANTELDKNKPFCLPLKSQIAFNGNTEYEEFMNSWEGGKIAHEVLVNL